MNRTVRLLVNNWRETRKLTLDFVHENSEDVLNSSLPRPGLNSIAKHLMELADVETVYAESLMTGRLDWSAVSNYQYVKRIISKRAISDTLGKADKLLFKNIKNTDDWEQAINIFGKYKPKYSILELLTRHETLHHGQFIAYGFLLGFDFPTSWIKAWALPANDE